MPTIEEQFATRRAEIADDDLEKRFELDYWLYENHSYQLAQREVADLMKRYPSVDRLKTLAADIDREIKLQDEPRSGSTTRPGLRRDSQARGRGAPNGAVPGVLQELSDEQINTIRLYESNPNAQTQPRVVVPETVIDKLFADYSDRDVVPKGARDQLEFRHAPGWFQLKTLFAVKARELYPDVEVLDDPPIINEFKSINQSYIVNYCGTPQCHGGEKAGNFFLFRVDPYSERTVFTNYYALYRYENKNGYMIDLSEPDKSYLLQYGLPPDVAKFPHPAVRGMDPRLREGNQDELYRSIRDWIAHLSPPRQNYPKLNYTPPTMPTEGVNPAGPDSAATRPAGAGR